MISAKQFKNSIEYMFSGIPGFIAPTATFYGVPPNYSLSSIPASIILTGVITPNTGIITNWSISDAVNTVLATGTNNSPTYTISAPPSSTGQYTYYLTVFYTDTNGGAQSFVVPTIISVTADASFGQLASPADNISIPGDLTPAIEATFTITNQQTIINLFSVVAPNTGRIVFVIPDSYGIVTAIEDGGALDVLSQFNIVPDPGNNRQIYVGINAATPATYLYKFIF